MHAGEQYSVGAGATGTGAASSTDQGQRQTAGVAETTRHDQPARTRTSKLLMALVWTLGAAGVFFLFLRIDLTSGVSSDAANNALQAWDLLHGHLRLHDWLIGDATYYTFDLPVIALGEVFFGLHTIAMHVAIALIYLIVAALAVVLAVTGASGAPARLSRAAVVVAILAGPALIFSDRWVPLGIPDHTGSTVFLLIPALLIDRAPNRRWTAPLLCVILCAGQIGDVTVRYVAVPAVILVCAYQIVAARKIRTGDTAMLVAAIVSLPLTTVVRAAMRHFGFYLMVSPHTKIVPVSEWRKNASFARQSVGRLFGVLPGPHVGSAGHWAIFGLVCLIVSFAGFLWVVVRWPRASRADQVLAVAIVANLGVYVVSTLPGPNTPHDIVAVLPAGAVLAARLLVPARLTGPGRLPRLAAAGVVAAAAIAALLPLSVTAAKPSASAGGQQQLVDWLESHGLTYGLGGYWNASSVTLLSSNGVQVRTVKLFYGSHVPYAYPYPWEASTYWYDPTRHYANFIVEQNNDPETVAKLEKLFGKPALTHHLGGPGGIEVLVYHKNLLTQVRQFSQLKPPVMPPVS